jgi:hypothetical protein
MQTMLRKQQPGGQYIFRRPAYAKSIARINSKMIAGWKI